MITQRPVLALALAAGLAACAGPHGTASPPAATLSESAAHAAHYAARIDGGFTVPAIPVDQVPEQFRRAVVPDPTGMPAGSILVESATRHLYFVLGDGRALRYGVACGRPGFGWSRDLRVASKRTWPVWVPPPPMIARQPELARWAGGQPPGPDNALGARAIYLSWPDGRDSGYRIHGTPEWRSIGQAASSGCIRMFNQDVIELHDLVRPGARVIIR